MSPGKKKRDYRQTLGQETPKRRFFTPQALGDLGDLGEHDLVGSQHFPASLPQV